MRRIALSTALILLMALAVGRPATAAPPSSEGGQDPLATSITVKWQNSDLKEVFETIFGAIGADYLLTDEISGKTITMQREASARDILEHVCASQGLHWWKRGQAYIVSSQPAPMETAASPAVPGATTGELSDQPRPKWRYYTSQYMNPRDLANMFNSSESKSPEGRAWRPELTALYSGGGAGQFSDTSLQPFGFGRNRLGEAAQFPSNLPPTAAARGTLPPALRERLAATSSDPTPARQTPGISTGRLSLANQDLLEGGIDITAPFAPLLPSGMTAPIAYEPLNLLVFEATDEAYDRFLELLRIFDQKPKQVILEVQFVTIGVDELYSLGLNFNYIVGQTLLSTSGMLPTGNVSISVAKGETFKATMSALFSTGRARLVNAPRIAAMNNFAANIHFEDVVPYVNFTGATAVPNGGIIAGGATLESVTVPTDLTIVPRINADDSITVLLNPVISNYSLVAVPTPDGGTQQVPLTSTNTLSTLLNIKNGETMVIGGFVRREENTTRLKVPLLGDLPLLGNLLFTRTDRNVSDSELLIFVTPHVIKDDTETTTVGPY